MVIIPTSTAVAEGLTFTMASEENQIRLEGAEVVIPTTLTTVTFTPTTSSATPTTRPLLPHYKEK